MPEGIAVAGPYAYVGSFASSKIYRIDLRSGAGHLLSDDPSATTSTGLKVDVQGRLFACGGLQGYARIIDTSTGEVLARYQLGEANVSLINDVLLTGDAAWFTDSRRQVLYKLPLNGRTLSKRAEEIPITGDFAYAEGAQNANGLTLTPDSRALLIVQSDAGKLFRVDPDTGDSARVDLGDAQLPDGDGMLLDGQTLYVVQSFHNALFKLRISADGRSGELLQTLTGDAYEGSTAVAAYGGRLCLPGTQLSGSFLGGSGQMGDAGLRGGSGQLGDAGFMGGSGELWDASFLGGSGELGDASSLAPSAPNAPAWISVIPRP
jgi:sugar lactone lactonase YvrE